MGTTLPRAAKRHVGAIPEAAAQAPAAAPAASDLGRVLVAGRGEAARGAGGSGPVGSPVPGHDSSVGRLGDVRPGVGPLP